MTWYACRTATRQETRALTSLRELGLDAWCPCETRLYRHGRIREPRQYPLLPGYIFVRLTASDVWMVNHKADGVSKIYGPPTETSRGSPVPEAYLAWLSAAESLGAFNRAFDPLPPTLHKGRHVRVTSGKLTGALGRIVEAKGQQRFLVALDAAGIFRKPIEFPQVELEPA